MARNKRPQIEWMLDQIAPFVYAHHGMAHGTDTAITQREPLRILDVGGGKGHLANGKQ